MCVTVNLAAAILPILQRHAATKLEQAGRWDARRLALADELRNGLAGGDAVEGLNQNTDDAQRDSFPDELDSFWRVLVAFEKVALGGHLLRGGKVSPARGATEQPYPWMLHAAAGAIQDAARAGDDAAQQMGDVVTDFLCTRNPPYRRLGWHAHAA